jgi:hypothetical protein
MKTAILINAQPRFTREFDDFLDNLKNYDELDFFFYIWTAKHNESMLIPRSWPLDEKSVRNKIINTLPEHCNLIALEVADPPEYIVPDYIQTNPWTNMIHVWNNYYSLKQVNILREQHDVDYDLVIRARGDVGTTTPIDLQVIHDHLMRNPKMIISPDNLRNGLGVSLNDCMAIGTGETMSIYANAIDKFETYHRQGVPYHAETLLACHLNVNGISYPLTGIHQIKNEYQTPRSLSHPDSVDYGRWS